MSTNSFQPRMRGHQPQSRFANSAKAAKAASARTQFKRPDGAFDRLVLGSTPIWVRLNPDQLYEQLLYSREEKKLIETKIPTKENPTPEYTARPWYEYTGHYVVARKRPFICSSGPGRDQPCRGCAIRAKFYDILRDQEKATSVKDEEKRKHPPIQASTRYGMACTCVEKIFEMPVMKDGKPRKGKNGQDITSFMPAPLSGVPITKQGSMPFEFGRNFHWSFGPVHLAQLAEMDMDLWNSCANCKSDLMTTEMHCAECNAVTFEIPEGVTGSDLRALREQPIKCNACGTEGNCLPVILCTGCDTPEEGSILKFDLRLKTVPIDDKKSDLKLEDFRVPNYVTIFKQNPTWAERISELVMSPLDIVTILAPDSIDQQAWTLPDDLKAVDAGYHLKEKASQPYGSDEGDADQMSFSDDTSS